MTMNKADARRTIASLNAVGSQVDRGVMPLRDYLREQWSDPEKVPHLVREVVRQEVEKTARTALVCATVVMLTYLAVELLKLWAAA